nr:unnamed protein product [Spirometra erinaceieuropaei]
MRQARDEQTESIALSDPNPGISVANIFRHRSPSKRGHEQPPPLNDNKIFLIDGTDKAELFAASFAKHLTTESEPVSLFRSLSDKTLSTIDVSSDLNRAVQTIKHGLAKQPDTDVATKLSRFLFGYRITPNDSTGASPAELMFKRQLRTRLDLLNPSTHDRVMAKQTKMKARYDVNTRPRVVAPNESVYTRLEHETNWCTAVVRASEGHIVELKLEDGRIVRQHMDQVRSRMDTASGEFGKFELPATLDTDPDIPRTEHLLPAQSTTPPTEAYVPPPPSAPVSTSLGAEEPVTAQSDAEVENTALRRSPRICKPVQRFQDESY